MKTDVKLLAQICEAPGAPGYEQKIRSLVLKHIKGLADKVEQTTDSYASIHWVDLTRRHSPRSV